MRMPSQTQERSAACCSRCFSPEVTRTEIGLVLLSFAIGCPVMGSADTQQTPIPRFFLWLACSEHCLEISCNVNRLATKASPCNQILRARPRLVAFCLLPHPRCTGRPGARRPTTAQGFSHLVQGHSFVSKGTLWRCRQPAPSPRRDRTGPRMQPIAPLCHGPIQPPTALRTAHEHGEFGVVIARCHHHTRAGA
jgi:hypothetical protein